MLGDNQLVTIMTTLNNVDPTENLCSDSRGRYTHRGVSTIHPQLSGLSALR